MKLDLEFGILCVVLLYTGLRLSEGLRAEIDRLRIEEGYLYMPRTKNGQARAVFLPVPAIEALRVHPRGLDRSGARIFKFHKSGHLYSLLRAAAARARVTLAERQAFAYSATLTAPGCAATAASICAAWSAPIAGRTSSRRRATRTWCRARKRSVPRCCWRGGDQDHGDHEQSCRCRRAHKRLDELDFMPCAILRPQVESPMTENGISDLKSKYDDNSSYAERIAVLIIVGLLVEIAAVFIFQKPWTESVTAISANALIVVGVWGELFFERRAKNPATN